MDELNTYFTEEELRYIAIGLDSCLDYTDNDVYGYKVSQIVRSVLPALEREQKRLREERLNAQHKNE